MILDVFWRKLHDNKKKSQCELEKARSNRVLGNVWMLFERYFEETLYESKCYWRILNKTCIEHLFANC